VTSSLAVFEAQKSKENFKEVT